MQPARRGLCLASLSALAATLLAGCYLKPPSCGDEQTLALVRSTLIEHAQKTVTNSPFSTEIVNHPNFQAYFSGLMITLSDITSDGYDAEAKKYSCHAQVAISASHRPDKLMHAIDYHTQATIDSGPHQWLLQLSGEADLVNGLAQAAVSAVQMSAAAPANPAMTDVTPSEAAYWEQQANAGQTDSVRMVTRFGTLSVSSDNQLLYNGKPTAPAIEGNSSLSLQEKKVIGDQDLVLLQNTGGTACPALFNVVQLSQSGLVISKEFGTCSDTYKLEQMGNKLTVTLPGFLGPFDSEQDRIKAAKQKHIFTFENGVLSHDGKPM